MFRSLHHPVWRHAIQSAPRMFWRGLAATTQKPFLLTDIGEGIQEVEIIEWYVKEGDSIKEFDNICKVQSDKASVDITSRFEGIVRNVAKADFVKVGQPLLFVESDASPATSELATDESNSSSPTTSELTVEDSTESLGETTSTEAEVSSTPILSNHDSSSQKVTRPMSPAVRKLVKDHSMDASNLTGSGPNGRILKSDALEQLSSNQEEMPFETIPLRGYNRIMFDSMTKSLERPHMSLTDEILVDEVWKMKHVSFLAVFLKAVSCSLSEYPILNATSNGKNELMLWRDHNIGIAMDTPNGLVVPVVRGVQKLSMQEIQEQILALKDKSPHFAVSDLQDATFTISNIGSIGAGLHATAVLGGDAVAMGVLGRKEVIPVYDADGDLFEPKGRVLASWTADHRFVDGATLAKFHKHLRTLLEKPREWLLQLK